MDYNIINKHMNTIRQPNATKKEEAKILMFKEKADQMEQVNRRLESKNQQLSDKINQLQSQLGDGYSSVGTHGSPSKNLMTGEENSLYLKREIENRDRQIKDFETLVQEYIDQIQQQQIQMGEYSEKIKNQQSQMADDSTVQLVQKQFNEQKA